MLTSNERIASWLDAAIKEMELLSRMSAGISVPEDFLTSLQGMTVYRDCGMSLQYVTEIFVKIRNLAGKDYFRQYKGIPWEQVFGMRSFLSDEYGEVDAEGIFNTVKTDIPVLLAMTRRMRENARGECLI